MPANNQLIDAQPADEITADTATPETMPTASHAISQETCTGYRSAYQFISLWYTKTNIAGGISMEKTISYVKSSAAVALGSIVIAAGLFAILGVLGWLEWETIGTWLFNIVVVIGIVFLVNALLAWLVNSFPSGE